MTTIELSADQAMAVLLGAALGVKPEEALEIWDNVMEDAKPRLPMTPEHDAMFEDWLNKITTATLLEMGEVIKAISDFHDAPDTHDYDGLCQRLGDLAVLTANIGHFRFGGDAYGAMVSGLWSE